MKRKFDIEIAREIMEKRNYPFDELLENIFYLGFIEGRHYEKNFKEEYFK